MSEPTESDKYLAPEQILEKLQAENAKLRKVLEKVRREGCNGPGSYDTISCRGDIKKKDWCCSCLADAVLHEADD